ncbi:MAG: hypothetical protein KW802_04445 [Candidatus Doudnabacteria bacterium]|nr:hypothetical protein [Candidatus Doudnabacteria bacterium]
MKIIIELAFVFVTLGLLVFGFFGYRSESENANKHNLLLGSSAYLIWLLVLLGSFLGASWFVFLPMVLGFLVAGSYLIDSYSNFSVLNNNSKKLFWFSVIYILLIIVIIPIVSRYK